MSAGKDEFREAVLTDLRSESHSHHAIWYLNIKKFRFINESYGYDAGDRIIDEFDRYLAERVMSRGMSKRLGDDRFVAFISQEFYETEDATEAFETLYREINKRVSRMSIEQPVEIAAGVYFLTPEDVANPDVDHIIDLANSAHRRAREQGGSHIIFYDYEFAEKQRRENAIEKDLTAAIAAGEIEVWMQPLLDFVKGEVVAAEALARWNHGRLGSISPAEFIPVLERCGKIAELDRFIWNVACYEAHHRTVETGELPIPFSVNVSRAEILDPTLPDYLDGLRVKYELPGSTLRLEVTESAYTDQPEELIRAVKELRGRGFIVEMDDFGSGYSSLNMLRNLPVDMLKLDMGFLRNERSDSNDAVILNSVIRMAHGLDIPVIAEGVETIEQAEMLKTMGCRLMQGYFFAKPMPIEQFYKLIKDTKRVNHSYVAETGDDKVAQLLDKRSDTAFFFNNCVGPAFIYSVGANRYEIMLANDSLDDELGVDRFDIELFRTNYLNLLSEESQAVFQRATLRALEGGSARCVVDFVVNNIWLDCSIRKIGGTEIGGVLACYVRNVTEQHGLEATHAKIDNDDYAAYDELTGLLTYHSLDELIGGDIGKDGGTLILLDIDEFDRMASEIEAKQVDDVVDYVASTIRKHLPNDGLLARCGEGLFAAFLPSSHDATNARVHACALVDALRTGTSPIGTKVTCSLGLSHIGAGTSTRLGILYRRALRALTIAKINGGDGFLLYETVRAEVSSGIEVFGVKLRHAVDGELLPQKALEGAEIFNVISRDFEMHHSWSMDPVTKRNVRDAVFGALRYRSMAEMPGIISFDYDVTDDCIHLESVSKSGELYQRPISSFSHRVFDLDEHLAAESMARLSTLLADLEYLPVSGNVDLKCRFDPDTDMRWYRFSFTSLRDSESFVIRGLGYGEDIDLSRESGMWWKDRAMHDGLTGLLNREGLEDGVELKLAKNNGGMMFIIDVDNFKSINDTLGHLSGDSVLCGLADTLMATFREYDVVGRYGSDEMIAFISDITDRCLAKNRAKQLVEMAHDIEVGEYGNITVCVGVGIIDRPNATFYDFLELSDRALHISKANGKDTFTVADESVDGIEIHSLRNAPLGTRSAKGKRQMRIEAKFNRERLGE